MIPDVLARDPWVPARKRRVLALTPIERANIDPIVSTWNDDDEPASYTDELVARAGAEGARALAREMFERGGIIPIYAGRHLTIEDVAALAEKKIGDAFADHYGLVRRTLARHGLDALPTLFRAFDVWPYATRDALACVDATAVARFFIERAADYPHAFERWTDAHVETTTLVLLPDVLGDGPRRDGALKMLKALRKREARAGRSLASSGIRSAAAAYGGEAVAEIDALFGPPPLPARAPKLPAFVALDALPPVTTHEGETLPTASVTRLVALAALLPQATARVAIDSALVSLDRASLANVADALLRAWKDADGPPKEKWVLHAAGLFGDDRAVRGLVAHAEEWAEQGATARAKLATEAIASVGTDVALMHLSFLTKKKKPKSVAKAAQAALARFAEENELSADELADRLVPDLGLEPDGSLRLDLGARSFRVGFDEELRPFVTDDSGARLASLPRANKADDAAKATAAHELWAALKAETKTLGAEQIRRLERAMVASRTWSEERFRRYVLDHPLMRHLARRLVWAIQTPRGIGATFRVAEDGTFADVDDAPLSLPSDASVLIAHAMNLREAGVLDRWSTVFADYQIVQPFPQLGREVFALADEERSASSTRRWEGKVARGDRFFSLKHRGWTFADYDLAKPLGLDELAPQAVLRTEPGVWFLSSKPEDQTLGAVTLRATEADAAAPTFGSLPAVVVSELFRDVEALLR